MPNVIHIEQLTVRYGSFTAVDRLDLELRPGELFGRRGVNYFTAPALVSRAQGG